MPANQGQTPSSSLAATNKELRTEISDLADKISNIADVMRNADSIYTSDNFHLDSKFVNDNYKVEIQYRRGSKKTVALVLVSPTATNLADLQTAINNSAKDGHIWNVT